MVSKWLIKRLSLTHVNAGGIHEQHSDVVYPAPESAGRSPNLLHGFCLCGRSYRLRFSHVVPSNGWRSMCVVTQNIQSFSQAGIGPTFRSRPFFRLPSKNSSRSNLPFGMSQRKTFSFALSEILSLLFLSHLLLHQSQIGSATLC